MASRHGWENKSKTQVSLSSADQAHFGLIDNLTDDSIPTDRIIENDLNEELDEKEDSFSKISPLNFLAKLVKAKVNSAIRFKKVNDEHAFFRSISIPIYLLFQSQKTDFC